MSSDGVMAAEEADKLDRFLASQDGKPRTKKQCLDAVVAELNLDMTHPFTRLMASAFALQDAYDECIAALVRLTEPTEEMIDAGLSEMTPEGDGTYTVFGRAQVSLVWDAMLKAAK